MCKDDGTCLLISVRKVNRNTLIEIRHANCYTQQYKLYEEFHKNSFVKHINKTAWQLVPISTN